MFPCMHQPLCKQVFSWRGRPHFIPSHPIPSHPFPYSIPCFPIRTPASLQSYMLTERFHPIPSKDATSIVVGGCGLTSRLSAPLRQVSCVYAKGGLDAPKLTGLLESLVRSHPIPSHPIPFILFHPIPCHAMPYRFIPSHPIPSHAMPCHLIPSHPISSHPIPSHLLRSHLISSHSIPFLSLIHI